MYLKSKKQTSITDAYVYGILANCFYDKGQRKESAKFGMKAIIANPYIWECHFLLPEWMRYLLTTGGMNHYFLDVNNQYNYVIILLTSI
jgi:hypothetical protein